MKSIIFSVIALLFLTNFQTKTDVSNTSEDYYIMASSGLKMYNQPNLKGQETLTIPYNGIVQLINDGKSYGELTITELGNFEIKGKCVKVRYKKQEGYVFSGYLTKFPLPNKDSGYLGDVLKVSTKKYDIRNYTDCDTKNIKKCECGWSESYYDNEITYSYSYCSKEMEEEYIIFNNINFSEIYLIYKAMGDIPNLKYNPSTQTITGEKDEKNEGGSYTVEIKKIGHSQYQIYTITSC